MFLKNVLSQETIAKDAAIPQGGWKLLFWLIAIQMVADSLIRYYLFGQPMSTTEIIVLVLLFLGYISMNARTGRVLWPFHWLRQYITRNVIGKTARYFYGERHGFNLHSIVGRTDTLPSGDPDEKTQILFILPLGGWLRGWGHAYFCRWPPDVATSPVTSCRIRRIGDTAYFSLRDTRGCHILTNPENAGRLLLHYCQDDYPVRAVSAHMNGGFTLNAAIAAAMKPLPASTPAETEIDTGT
jgi:hypothetical protein